MFFGMHLMSIPRMQIPWHSFHLTYSSVIITGREKKMFFCGFILKLDTGTSVTASIL